jgi:hypothetical protein
MTPTYFTLIVFIAGLAATRTTAIYIQIVLCLFGAASAIDLPALGGAVITPSVLFLPFLVVRSWSEQYGRRYIRHFPIAAAWLTLVVIWGALTAYYMPQLFAGAVEVIAVDRSSVATGPSLGPLRPVSGNVTQTAYALGGLLTFISMHALLLEPRRLRHFRDAVLLLAALNCVAALYNLGQFHAGFPRLLDYVRTAYALFDAYEAAGTGLMRIHGTFSETAGFSGFSLPLFAFCFTLWLNKVRPWYSGALAFTLFALLLLSTSTTAYVGLALYFSMLMFVLIHRGYVHGTVPRIGVLVAGALLATVVLGSTFVLETEFARQLEGYLQLVVFNKLSSDSGVERSFWNHTAWSNFVDTYGLGVGLGSVRASSYALVLLSNLGLVGTVFFLKFVQNVFKDPTSAAEPPVLQQAFRQAVLACFAATLPSGTVFDLGVLFYSFAAAACAAGMCHFVNENEAGPRAV